MRKVIVRLGILGVTLIGNVMVYRSATQKRVNQILQSDVVDSKELVILGKSVDIELLPSENDELYVALNGKATKRFAEQLQLNMQDDNGVLTIALEKTEAANSKKLLNVIEQSFLKLQVMVPKKQWQKITIETTSGDADIHDLTVDELLLQSRSGDLRLQQLVAQKVTIDNRSGDVQVEGVEAAILSAEVTSGDVNFKNVTATDLTSKSTSGTQNLTKLTTETGHLKTTSGDLKATHLAGDSLSIETTSGTSELTLAEPHQKLSISSTSGDILVNYEHKISDLKVSSTHKSGDVSIKLDDAKYVGEEIIVGAGSNALTVTTTSGSIKVDN